MPCKYYTPAEEAELAWEEANRLTRMLCSILQILDLEGRTELYRTNHDIVSWWEKHKQKDAARIAQEQERIQESVVEL